MLAGPPWRSVPAPPRGAAWFGDQRGGGRCHLRLGDPSARLGRAAAQAERDRARASRFRRCRGRLDGRYDRQSALDGSRRLPVVVVVALTVAMTVKATVTVTT